VVLLNETFTKNISFLVSFHSGPAKWTSIHANAVQGRSKGLPGHGACSSLLIETKMKRNQ
jgi:hypothetical protein